MPRLTPLTRKRRGLLSIIPGPVTAGVMAVVTTLTTLVAAAAVIKVEVVAVVRIIVVVVTPNAVVGTAAAAEPRRGTLCRVSVVARVFGARSGSARTDEYLT